MSGAKRGVVLYRAILKAHSTKLPSDLKVLGNAYVRNEFKLHKKVESTKELQKFFTAWDYYLDEINKRTSIFGKDLEKEEQSSLTEEQHEKLQELKKEASTKTEK
jgi:hypothetical protein